MSFTLSFFSDHSLANQRTGWGFQYLTSWWGTCTVLPVAGQDLRTLVYQCVSHSLGGVVQNPTESWQKQKTNKHVNCIICITNLSIFGKLTGSDNVQCEIFQFFLSQWRCLKTDMGTLSLKNFHFHPTSPHHIWRRNWWLYLSHSYGRDQPAGSSNWRPCCGCIGASVRCSWCRERHTEERKKPPPQISWSVRHKAKKMQKHQGKKKA